MRVHNVHERALAAAPETVVALFGEMEELWPTHVFPAPEPDGEALRLGMMVWQPVERVGSPQAYDIVAPEGFNASHWFEVGEGADGGAILRHTVTGEAVGEFEPAWRDRIEPLHNAYMEALFDRAQEKLA
jgi:hypothetical protein